MGIIAGLFVLSLFGFGFLPFIFFPDSERNLLTVNLNLPLGTKVETTTARVEQLESYIADSLLVSENRQRGGNGLGDLCQRGAALLRPGLSVGRSQLGVRPYIAQHQFRRR